VLDCSIAQPDNSFSMRPLKTQVNLKQP